MGIYSWVVGFLFDFFKKNVSNIVFYAIIAIVVLVLFFYVKYNFIDSKNKLIKENAEQTALITTLKNANANLEGQLNQCEANAKLKEDTINSLNEKIQQNNYFFNSLLSDKNKKINDILAKPDKVGTTIDIYKPISTEKRKEISQVQINSLWSAYEKINPTTSAK